MGNRLTLPLLFLAALLAGGAFLWTAGDERGGQSSARGAETPEAKPAAAAPAELATPDVPLQDEVAPARAPARVEVFEESAPAERVLASDGPSVGVTGIVLDRFGTPVADARVAVMSDVGIAFDVVGAEEIDWLRRKKTKTDAAGRFRFADVRPGTVRLDVRAPGFAPYEARGVSIPASDTELDPVELARGAILTGMVVGPHGGPVAGAELIRLETDSPAGVLFVGGGQEASAVTGPDGRFRVDELACGPWRFLVRSEDHPDGTFEGLAEEPGVEVGGLVWELEPGATIAGTVTGVPAAERGQLEVRASRGDGGLFGSSRKAEVDAGGAFVVRGLEVGQTYSLRARNVADRNRRFGSFERSRSNSVQARAGDSGVVLAYQPEAAITFRVVDASTQRPVEHMRVESGTDWTVPLQGEDGQPRKLFPGGEVRIGGLRPASDSDRVQLEVTATGYRDFARSGIAVRAGQEIDLGTIQLDPVPVVRVHVVDQRSGEPVANATVRLQKDPGDERTIRRSFSIDEDDGHAMLEIGEGRSAQTDADGWAEITSFEGAVASLTVKARGYAEGRVDGLVLPNGSDLEREVALSLGGEVLVRVLDNQDRPVPGARVQHRAGDGAPAAGLFEESVFLGGGGGGRTVTDSRGEVLFENLSGGLHSFRISDGGGNEAVFASADSVVVHAGGGDPGDEDWSGIQVVEGGRVELVLRAKPVGELAGRVREAGKVLAGATLRLEKREQQQGRPRMMFPGMGGADEAKSDGNGRYRFGDVKAGEYTLVVEHPTRCMPEKIDVDVREGENTLDVELPVSIVSGRIVDEEGKGVAGVQVSPERKLGGSGGPSFRMVMIMDDGDGGTVSSGQGGFGEPARTDAEGYYELRGVASDVDLVVKAQGDSVQPAESEVFRVAPDEVRKDVDIAAKAAGKVVVEARLADGSPARMQLVQAEFLGDAEKKPEPKFGFMQSGTTTLTGMRPGLWRVTVSRPQGNIGGGGGDPGQEQEVEVVAGESRTLEFTVE